VIEEERNSILEENSFLKSEPLTQMKIKQLVEEEVKVSMASVEEKFMSYLRSIEEQMNELRLTNREIRKVAFKEMSSESNSSLRSGKGRSEKKS
jgi:hypothetical protein